MLKAITMCLNNRNLINVTFFNQFGDYFIQEKQKVVEEPIIIVICCAKVSEWKGTEK